MDVPTSYKVKKNEGRESQKDRCYIHLFTAAKRLRMSSCLNITISKVTTAGERGY